MKRVFSLALLVFWALTTTVSAQNIAEQCTIKGKVLNRDSKVLTIRKTSESLRSFLSSYPKIEINNGQFEYTFSFDETEAYELIFEDELEQGSWNPTLFFPFNGVVEFKLHPQKEWGSNLVSGGALNAEFTAFKLNNEKLFGDRKRELIKIQDILIKNQEFNSQEYKDWSHQINAAKTHEEKVPLFEKRDELEKTHARYTEKAKLQFVNPYASLIESELYWKYDYIQKNNSLVSYYLMWFDVEMELKRKHLVAKLVTDIFPEFEKKYPTHIYTTLIATQVDGMKTITPGKKYIDIKAPSIDDGDTIQLSSIIQNRIALIDLWGSWCGPCIAKTRLILPIFHKYNDKGFEVVGIAREFKSTDAVKNRVEVEGYPWTNLFDLDDKLGIWNQYGISNGVGLMVLVDKDGIILAVDPKPEELEEILKTKLNL